MAAKKRKSRAKHPPRVQAETPPYRCKHGACAPAKDEPTGYGALDDWQQRKLKTHTVEQCPTCGLYTIWSKSNGD